MLHESPLGKAVQYRQDYAPSILFAIPRSVGRAAVRMPEPLPFHGLDIWTGYELSWLNMKGKPMVGVGEFRVPAASEYLVESKSFKLYLNSINNKKFTTVAQVRETLAADLSRTVGAEVLVSLTTRDGFVGAISQLSGTNIDDLDVTCECYEVCPGYLRSGGDDVIETLSSDLLRSNCPVTGQPDWASVMVRYAGPQVDRAGLLQYIVSYREHTGFHEQCVEQIFMDINTRCRPHQLTVYARYTRRGGLDINPFRSNFEQPPPNVRNFRQ